MSSQTTVILFEFVALIFAFCVHEAAHAWMASRLGDQTARMLGRVTLNPAKHLDPLGSVLFPLIAAFTHAPLIGWAKPCPVQPRNFKNYKRDDILVTLAGPVSNLILAIISLVVLIILRNTSIGAQALGNAVSFYFGQGADNIAGGSILIPLSLFLFAAMMVNLSLFAFNLIPIPPLDGANVLTHFLPMRLQETYQRIGAFSLILLMVFGGRMLGVILNPILGVFFSLLFNLKG